ncbi:MAG: HIT domain-containing protein [Arcobacter sp.]|uniref:HIT family protein n=1 Tax=Arcobacter sp. TaxID=1872629 RepID=UPI00258F3549|nr:HIT domain-containing protein [Arcobacter sp.]MDD3008504.1 HIT domain-containing protein [Arcobacter sp.]
MKKKLLNDCKFCNILINKDELVEINKHAFAIYDKFPVTKYHTIIMPIKHIENYFELTLNQLSSINELLHKQKENLLLLDPTIIGFNIGINNGKSTGQTIKHLHIHLIPRKNNDIKNPEGGIRGIIPNKMKY